MTLPLWIISGLRWLEKGATGAWGILRGMTPAQWLIGALLAALAFQTVRIEGLSFLHKGFKERIAEYEAIEAAVAPKKAKADTAAKQAVEATKADVEAGNQRARNAAAGSDDPLRDGLGALK